MAHLRPELDYFAWEALFAVLSVEEARSAAQIMLPGLLLETDVISVAESIHADWRTFPARNLGSEVIENAVGELRALLSGADFRGLARVGHLLQPDPSENATIAWAWIRVLRRWQADPRTPDHLARLVARCSETLSFRPDRITATDPPEWQGLLEFAQGRLIAAEVRGFLLSLTPKDQEDAIAAAKRTADELEMPGDLVEIPAFAIDTGLEAT
jgi:hypothetical protein